MPKLNPLTPVRYSLPPQPPQGDAAPPDISSKIAPPYDVLDEAPKRALLDKDPHNIVAIDLPVTPPKTVGPDEAYASAGELYRAWLAEGVLMRDDEPAVVAYEQVYKLDGQAFRRRGLFATLKVEDFNRRGGGIFRHEKTIAGGIGDRTKLMAATAAQLSPIFGIFSDAEAKVTALLDAEFNGREPDYDGTTANDGVAHRCWLVRDPQKLESIAKFFDQTDVFIADGHHRYTTALEFSQSHEQLVGRKLPGADGCLFVLVAAEDPGMIVLPTHRMVTGLSGFSMQALADAVKGRKDLRLTVTEMPREELPSLPEQLSSIGPHAMGLYSPQDKRVWTVTFSDDPLAQSHADKPEVWRKLDVAILHELLIGQVLKPWSGGQELGFKYTAEVGTLMDMLAAEAKAKRPALGVLMQPTPLESVMAVSQADEVMPSKSTYFYPKLATGLVVNPLD